MARSLLSKSLLRGSALSGVDAEHEWKRRQPLGAGLCYRQSLRSSASTCLRKRKRRHETVKHHYAACT